MKVTRMWCPSPWHDGLTAQLEHYARQKPGTAIEHVGERYGLKVWHVVLIRAWCRLPERTGPCPVV